MLVDVGCRWVIVGHSERRQLHGESDAVVAAKAAAALAAGLRPIVCVGESLAEREAGKTLDVVRRQLGAVLDRVGDAALMRGALAYEPVWAIGTGRTATPEQAQEVHAALRAQVSEKSGQCRRASNPLRRQRQAGECGRTFRAARHRRRTDRRRVAECERFRCDLRRGAQRNTAPAAAN